jgi:hypothetical protein
MITNVVLSERFGRKFVTFFTCEKKAKENSLDLSRFFKKSILTIDEFLKLQNVNFYLGNKNYKSVKGLIKAEIKYVKENYPLDLKHYSNIANL